MLLNFRVENFLSFKDLVEVDLKPSSIKELEENIALIPTSNTRVLKSAVVYGANSSGKSNLLKAIIFMKSFVMNSSKEGQANQDINVESFKLNSRTEKKPSLFEIIFYHEGLTYRYGFTVDSHRVHREWLFYSKINKEYKYFVREDANQFDIDDKFEEGKGLVKVTRDNALFLSVVAQFNGSISMELLRWFTDLKYITDTNKQFHQNYTSKLLENKIYHEWIMKFLKHVDLGFSDLEMEKINFGEIDVVNKRFREFFLLENKGDTLIKTIHYQYDENGNEVGKIFFNLNKNESLGTQKYFAISGLIIETLATGNVLIIDEFDARLHPNLSSFIVNLFNSKLNNPRNAQLIFVTHNTNLLSKKRLRRDQILLAEKDRKLGFTSISSLMDKKVRTDEAYEKNYLEGEYGGVPYIQEDINLFDNYI